MRVYEINRDATTREYDEKRYGARQAKRTIRNLASEAEIPEGFSFEVWIWKHREEVIERRDVDGLMALVSRMMAKERIGTHIFIKTPNRRILFRIGLKRALPILPPNAKSEGWTKADKRQYRFFMILLGVVYQGSYNCRYIAGTTTPSQHGWRNPPQAHDFRFRSQAQGDKRVAKARRKWDGEWFYCWENCPNHRSWAHVHGQKVPAKTGRPPCMS